MKFIINTTNLQSGGALQVALSLLEEWKNLMEENEYHVFLSPQLTTLIDQNNYNKNFRFYLFTQNPTSTIIASLTFSKKLQKLEKEITPDAVFSVFGPALWKPKHPHLVGFANGYYLFDDSKFIQKRIVSNFFRRIKYYLRRKLLFFQLKKEAKNYWVETEIARKSLSKVLNNSNKKISVIGNTYGRSFKNNIEVKNTANNRFSLLYVSAYYQHKNFEIITEVIAVLKRRNVRCLFMLTLPESAFSKLFGAFEHKEYLQNIGPVNPGMIYLLYQNTDAVFMPSLLETFSANYPEAMICKKPILSSNYDFATTICGDAALYFDPGNATDIADKIELLLLNPEIQTELILAGQKQLENMETPESRAEKILNLLKEIAQNKIGNK